MSWILHDQEGQWETGDWTVRVALQSSPEIRFFHHGAYLWGVSICPTDPSISSNVPTAPSTGSDLRPSDFPASDFYVRGEDLVAAYAERAPLPFAYQVYFCALPSDPKRVCLEMWLSVQTSTLEAHPTLLLNLGNGAGTDLSPGFTETPGVVALRNGTAGLIVHPLDQKDVTIDLAPPAIAPFKAFGGFMEKGVIRRMRLQLVTSNEVIAPGDWDRIVSEFAASPLPLTA
ncbi:hypothetical protein VN12_09475 [Pirellula sp. SH-Sr6A]|uniref:hypothetical protein n=1 Tax=Pirellula sp. SH-Sr6A TaxID=1632865 RepID=UPI00078BDC22|nr:hypothetical protein [Pirellula sp. SH-Sr6A]AMV32342.1 hypothetical protein VN12_09475 [Pirellula sp. SH-Sr6A]